MKYDCAFILNSGSEVESWIMDNHHQLELISTLPKNQISDDLNRESNFKIAIPREGLSEEVIRGIVERINQQSSLIPLCQFYGHSRQNAALEKSKMTVNIPKDLIRLSDIQETLGTSEYFLSRFYDDYATFEIAVSTKGVLMMSPFLDLNALTDFVKILEKWRDLG